MKTSSAPRSSSVNPLQERSTSAFSELSAVPMETEKNKPKFIIKYNEKGDAERWSQI